MVDDKPILEQVHELQVLVNKMNNLTIPLPEISQVGAIVDKLPPSWKDFSKRMMHKYKDYSLDDLLKHLRIEEETRNRDKRGKAPTNVHSVQVGGKGKEGLNMLDPLKSGTRGQSSSQRNIKRIGNCHVCGETRHYAKECTMRKSGTSGTISAVDEIENLVTNLSLEEIDMLAVNGSVVLAAKGGWYFDTRATIHVCDFRDKFVEYHEVHYGKQETVANRNRADVVGIWNGGDGVIVFVKDDRFVGRAYHDRSMYMISLKDHADDTDSDSDDNVNEVSDDESDDESIGSNVMVVDEVASGSDSISDSFVFPVDAFEFENGSGRSSEILFIVKNTVHRQKYCSSSEALFTRVLFTRTSDLEATVEQHKAKVAATIAEESKRLDLMQEMIENNNAETDKQMVEVLRLLKTLKPPTTIAAANHLIPQPPPTFTPTNSLPLPRHTTPMPPPTHPLSQPIVTEPPADANMIFNHKPTEGIPNFRKELQVTLSKSDSYGDTQLNPSPPLKIVSGGCTSIGKRVA
ncbi:hypothetical protein OSB04_025028 [Centaurea solstitialis]|uniref:CCHC-type domain-containing protein n=1 Tax=Centaurea solstitialis TaxID=347529 RepID=A0AA38SYZ0_9ASTR|nr:hypothetical protein OSB04_025028 [Centaurea solstitialis]